MTSICGEFERPVREMLSILRNGGVIGLATDTTYAVVAALTSHAGVQRLRELRNLPPSKHLSLLLRDLEHVSRYGLVDRTGYRLIKRVTPGQFTFILRATKELPRLTLTKQRTVGIRICGVSIVDALCEGLDEPLISASAWIGENAYAETADQMAEHFPDVNLVLDGGMRYPEVSTVVDLTGTTPVILRQGSGNLKGILTEEG